MRRAGILAAVRAKLAPCSVVPPPTITKYCGTARPPTRRTLPWNPIVATWCWPQPFGQPLILMRARIRGGDEIGTRAQVVLEQPAQTARLRDGEPARLGARGSS